MWDIAIGTFLEGRWIVFIVLSMSTAVALILGTKALVNCWPGRNRK